MSEKVIGIYGGSFNPPHLGHYFAATWAHFHFQLERLLIIPCAEHPHGKVFSDFQTRMKWCKTTFSSLSNTEVLDIEEYLPKPSYTYQTCQRIKEFYPDSKLLLFVGDDLKEEIIKWTGWDRLSKLAEVSVVPRSTMLFGISSSSIRDCIKKQDICAVNNYLHPGIKDEVIALFNGSQEL